MVEKTMFEVNVPTSKTRDEEVVDTPISNTIEEKHKVSPNYHLAHDRVGRKIVPPQRHNYTNLICYALNVAINDKMNSLMKNVLQSL